jgi:hypothetical protein
MIWASAAVSQGVPTVDGNLFIRNEAANLRRESDLATQAERLSTIEAISEIEREQLAVLQQILDAQSSFDGQGIPAMVSTLEDGTICIPLSMAIPVPIKCSGTQILISSSSLSAWRKKPTV